MKHFNLEQLSRIKDLIREERIRETEKLLPVSSRKDLLSDMKFWLDDEILEIVYRNLEDIKSDPKKMEAERIKTFQKRLADNEERREIRKGEKLNKSKSEVEPEKTKAKRKNWLAG